MRFCNSDCIHLNYGNMGHKVYRWGFPCLDYSFDVLVSWSHKLSLYNCFCLYSILLVYRFYQFLWCFLSLGNNLGYMNSGYSDVRYIWYIYEDFLVWIILSTYLSHETVNWSCTAGFTCIQGYRFYQFYQFVWYFLNLGDNSGLYELRIQWREVYGIYMRVFLFGLFLDVLTLQIGNLGLYNWFYCIHFTFYLLTCFCMFMLTTQFSVHAL